MATVDHRRPAIVVTTSIMVMAKAKATCTIMATQMESSMHPALEDMFKPHSWPQMESLRDLPVLVHPHIEDYLPIEVQKLPERVP